MFDTALLLAHGHIGDLLAEADRERRADQVRSAGTRTGSSRTAPTDATSFLRRVLRALRAMPRATAR